jgi:hypothetical protein
MIAARAECVVHEGSRAGGPAADPILHSARAGDQLLHDGAAQRVQGTFRRHAQRCRDGQGSGADHHNQDADVEADIR